MSPRRTSTHSKTEKEKKISSKQLADLVCKGAEKKHAEEIEVIDVRNTSSICNYLVVCTAGSAPQLAAIADGIEEALSKRDVKVPRAQGQRGSNWLVIDFINVVVHIMGREEREKYALDELWGKSGIIYHV